MLSVMKFPRLVKLVQRELEYDKIDLTREQKLQAIMDQIDLTEKEKEEVKNLGLILCPQTIKDFYCQVREVEKKLN